MPGKIEPGSLDGFTLFLGRKDGKSVWQLSYRKKEEPGWSVNFVSEPIARGFLDLLSEIKWDRFFEAEDVNTELAKLASARENTTALIQGILSWLESST